MDPEVDDGDFASPPGLPPVPEDSSLARYPNSVPGTGYQGLVLWAAPVKANRQPPKGAEGGPRGFPVWVNLCKTFPWEGFGGNWYTQRVPG